MITLKHGDIFSSKAQAIVAPVNCVGVMGKGLAEEFRRRFPKMNQAYVRDCKNGELRIGRPLLYRDSERIIICFPTKDDWRKPSQNEFIEAGLKTFVAKYKEWGIESIAFPALGCGLGGLNWESVRSLMMKYFCDLPIEIDVYEPSTVTDKVSQNPSVKR